MTNAKFNQPDSPDENPCSTNELTGQRDLTRDQLRSLLISFLEGLAESPPPASPPNRTSKAEATETPPNTSSMPFPLLGIRRQTPSPQPLTAEKAEEDKPLSSSQQNTKSASDA